MKRAIKIRKNAGGPGEVQKATKLTNLSVEEVSLVDHPAIGKTFYITKNSGEKAEKTEGQPVEKADETPLTFNQIITMQNLNDALWDAFYTLREVVFNSVGQANATDLVQLAFAQCSQYVLGLLNNQAVVAKAMEIHKAEKVAKAGAKISGANMQMLQGHMEQLTKMGEAMQGCLDMCNQACTDMQGFMDGVTSQPTEPAGGVAKTATNPEPTKTATTQELPVKTGMPTSKAIDPGAVAELLGTINNLAEVVKNNTLTPEKMAEIAQEVAKSAK